MPLNERGDEQARGRSPRAARRPSRSARDYATTQLEPARLRRDPSPGTRSGSTVMVDPTPRESTSARVLGTDDSPRSTSRIPSGIAERREGGTAWPERESSDRARVLEALEAIAAAHLVRRVLGGRPRRVPSAAVQAACGDAEVARLGLRRNCVLWPVSPSRAAASDGDRLNSRWRTHTGKYKGEQVEVALFGGEYQDGSPPRRLLRRRGCAHRAQRPHPHPAPDIASLHRSSRCDAPQNDDWPPRGLLDDDGRGEPEDG